MKEQIQSAILPPLPIVGTLKLSTRDGKSLYSIEVVRGKGTAKLSPFFENCYQELHHFLSGQSKGIAIEVDTSYLTPFQQKVLKSMRKIPYGQVATYKDLALKINSKAYQAIGNACGNNPFLLIYPCHRVVGTNNPGGFAHGLKMKKELLKLEGSEF